MPYLLWFPEGVQFRHFSQITQGQFSVVILMWDFFQRHPMK